MTTAKLIDEAKGMSQKYGELVARIVDYNCVGMGIRFEFGPVGEPYAERQVTLEKAQELMAQFRSKIQ